MEFFRSQQMTYLAFTVLDEDAWRVFNEIGKLNAVEFVDLTPNEPVYSKLFTKWIKRAEDVERTLRFFETEMNRFEIPIKKAKDPSQFLELVRARARTMERDERFLFEDLEREVQEADAGLSRQIQAFEAALETRNGIMEHLAVLKRLADLIAPERSGSLNDSMFSEASALINQSFHEAAESGGRFKIVSGCISANLAQKFQRMIFRASRGKVLTFLDEIEEKFVNPKTGEKTEKSLFIIFYPSGDSDAFRSKISKICEAFNCNQYDLPPSYSDLKDQERTRQEEFHDTQRVLASTKTLMHTFLDDFAKVEKGVAAKIEFFKWFFAKEKLVYHNINKSQVKNKPTDSQNSKLLHAEAWCPTQKEEIITVTINNLVRQQSQDGDPIVADVDMVPSQDQPKRKPTYFKLNSFTEFYQGIVDTYGVPRYEEINPALFTCVTFPFLFGVMFGDVFHGSLIFIFGMYLLMMKTPEPGSNMLVLYPARYMIAMMGFFATYCGFIYNDFAAVPLNVANSCYSITGEGDSRVITYDKDCVYPFGMDPIWYICENDLDFFNSFKMKLSVIIGVIHMTLGIFLKALNAIHFKKPYDFWFEFVPQLTFMLVLFGYMDFMIFYKWTIDYTQPDSKQPPNIIKLMIDMPVKFGKVEDETLYGTGNEQEHIQMILISIAMLCIPLMLFPKPLLLRRDYLREKANGGEGFSELRQYDRDEDEPIETDAFVGVNPSIEEDESESEEYSMGNLMIHQFIETIEYVLGAVSNTASYLRLWALSLAHSQLAEVFFEKSLEGAIEQDTLLLQIIAISICFVGWGLVTFGVLLGMDSMECFLHSLRLHWVEFQTKFYHGDGVPFQPYGFTNLSTEYQIRTEQKFENAKADPAGY